MHPTLAIRFATAIFDPLPKVTPAYHEGHCRPLRTKVVANLVKGTSGQFRLGTRHMQTTRTVLGITAALMLAISPVAPASTAGETLRAKEIAAGYEAIFLCSDTFVGHMSESAIDGSDLTGWRFPLDSLHATIDRKAKRVSVQFDPGMPPRIAVWRPLLGCAHLPIGANPDLANAVPSPPHELAPPSLDRAVWPRGDANAIAPLPAAQKTALDALVAKAFDGSTYGKGGKTSSVLVLLDGRIVAEHYALGVTMHTPQRTWSM